MKFALCALIYDSYYCTRCAIPKLRLLLVVDQPPYCLDEPGSSIIFRGFGDSALEFLFGVWFAMSDHVALRNDHMKEIKARFNQADIEIPFPHRSLYAGSVSPPFNLQIVPAVNATTGTSKQLSMDRNPSLFDRHVDNRALRQIPSNNQARKRRL